ncbi:class I SAM-dependent methyltransferase [Oryzifoliimicrobium ureilyticus]|uniref:class I SAM-dependent methyltransferase n=1 Tax=Oryzifoliimicrobium ureilyticus TaxID=3113724 RepID=UPI0030768375
MGATCSAGSFDRAEQKARLLRRHLALMTFTDPLPIRLYLAHPGSRLSTFVRGKSSASPYWAYLWAGGWALAHHIARNPQLVCGKRILDLGAGSGFVAIVAALCGARIVRAAEIDDYAIEAMKLNSAANSVHIEIAGGMLDATNVLDQIDLILAGDVFYDEKVARSMFTFLSDCSRHTIDILIGDPGRTSLPRERLCEIASYDVRDFGLPEGATVEAGVFRLK